MTTKNLNRACKLCLIGFLSIMSITIIHIAIDMVYKSRHITSFPWYSSIILVGGYYIVPVLVLLGLTVLFQCLCKKNK